MNKVIKIFLSIVSSVILALIILPLLVTLLLYIPSIQNFAGRKFAGIASDKLQTNVTIDRLRLVPFSKVSIDGFCVEDHLQDTLLYCDNLKVDLSLWQVISKGLTFREVELENPKFYISQNEDGTTNFRKILNKLKNDKPKKKQTAVEFGSLKVRNMTFRFNKLKIRHREYGVNFDDIAVDGFYVDAQNVSILGDSISLAIKDLAVNEKSGFKVNSLHSDAVIVSGTQMSFDNFYVLTPDSEVDMDYLVMKYCDWKCFSDFINKVDVSSSMKRSKVSFATIAFFAPRQRTWKSVVYNATARVDGRVSDMRGQITAARVNDATDVALRFSMKGLPDVRKTEFDFDIERLVSNAGDIRQIVADVTGKELSPSLVGKIDNMGDIDVKGKFKGSLARFAADATVGSQLGGAAVDLHFNPAADGRTAFAGNVRVDNLDLGKMLDAKKLGGATIVAGVDGTFGGGKVDGQTNARIQSLEFNDYAYRDIAMNGYLNNTYFKGNIGSNDPNIKFDFDGMLDFNDSIPRFDFDMRLFNADLNKLNFVKRDSVSVLRCNIVARGDASSLDDFNGNVRINDLLYVGPADTVRPGTILLRGVNDQRSKLLELNSGFAEVKFRSRMSYAQVMQGVKTMLHSYIPSLAPRERPEGAGSTASSDFNNYSLLSVDIKEANNVAGIFVPGLVVAKGSKLSFLFNPVMNKFSLAVSSDYLEYKNNFTSKLRLDTHNNSVDSLTLYLRADDLYASGFYMPDFSVQAGARDNRINTAVRFSDKSKDRSALIGLAATLGRSPETGIPQMTVRTTPSSFINKDKVWSIYSGGVIMDSTAINVRSFGIAGNGQHLRVNGIASRNATDTLHINLSNFDLGMLTQVTENMGYVVSGRTNGHADIMSALKDGYLHARIDVDSMKVNDIDVPPMLFESSWDFQAANASFSLADKARKTEYLTGNYWPENRRYDADVKFSDFNMALLDPLLKGVVRNTEGSANATIKITGERRALKLNGNVAVPRFTTTVDYLNVPYTMTNGTIRVVNNELILPTTVLRDPDGNKADFDFRLNLNSLSNMIYSLGVKFRDMQVLNTTEKNNDLFYGKVYASGSAEMRGDKRGINMSVTATTSGNSSFYLPLSDGATSAGADVIRFINPNRYRADSTDYLVRKRMILSGGNRRRGRANRSSMNIDMVLNVLPNMDFQLLIDPKVGDILEGRGRGLLNLNVNPNNGVFTMSGDYEISEGSYQFTLQDILSKKFQIEPGGRIMWTGNPTDAELNVSAVYKLKASLTPLLGATGAEYARRTVPVECRVKLTDRLSNPTVTFDVSLPSADPETQMLASSAMSTQEGMARQFVFLLAANTFYADEGGMSSIGTAAGNTMAFELLSNQIGNLLSNEKFNIGVGYKRNEEWASDEYSLDFSTQLFENRLLLEVEGSYDTGDRPMQGARGNASNLTGDFYLTWLIDQAGNLRAKGFTRTIDRFDDYGLQESGVGLYYKEDFNTVSDIVRNFRNRFRWRSNKQRKKALEAEEQAKQKEEEIEGTATDVPAGQTVPTEDKTE